MKKEIVASGIRPTGFLHIGNYFGAIKNFIAMQFNYETYFFIADLHSLTTHPDTCALGTSVKRVLAEYLACGLNPKEGALYCQSHVPETTELYLYLMMLAYKGELEKTASFKEKIKLHKENINAGLLTYPVLMAADILLHRAHKVPVGKDQEQHLEMSRTYANRFNHRYDELFPEPQAFNDGESLVKVPSLDGVGKMSKSENINATIYLNDSDEVIKKKVSKIKTDAGPTEHNSDMPDYIQNIFTLLHIVASKEVHNKFLTDYNQCQIKYGELKNMLSEAMINFIKPIREKAEYYINNEKLLADVLEEGTSKARKSGQETLKKLKELMHLNYFAK